MDLAGKLAEASVHGPQIVYVDNSSDNPQTIMVLTREVRDRSWSMSLTDRERALIRALLHLAQDRLDATNPHD